ncbi:MAG: hypothetical protein KBA50_05515 [Sedimentibacter sp.]|nr:hypothetical protein [Sedimentibacter sp.]
MSKENLTYDQSFTKPIIKYGMITNLLGVLLSFVPSFVLLFVYDIFPGVSNILSGWVLIVSIYGIYAIVEPVSYFPILGLPGTYMSFLAGNIGNMRVPCSAIAQEAVGVTPGSKKAELVSTLGIAGSIITNMIVVTIAAVGGAALMNAFPPIVIEAFTYVSPAIFGAIFSLYASKKIEYGAFALIVVGIMLLVIKVLPTYVMIPVAVFSTVFFAFKTHDMRNRKNK